MSDFDLEAMSEDEYAEGRRNAVDHYNEKTGRNYSPWVALSIPVVHLRETMYQRSWGSLEAFKADRCRYDEETNSYLEWLVTERLLEDDIPPIYLDLDVHHGRYALVDGSHRLTAYRIAGRTMISAQLSA